jgi:hypothetical protein
MLSLAIIICMLYLATLAHQERVIYVLPEDQPLTHCPEEEDCYRLTELINHDLLFGDLKASNTTIALLPGTHTCTSAVNKTLSISNATNFALRAANSSAGATIKCNGSIGFEFSFITNLTITGVVFTECGSYQTCDFSTYKGSPRSITFTLFLNYSTDANISNVTITDGNGVGLILMNPQGQTTIVHSNISRNNHGNIFVFSIDSKSIALSDTIIIITSSNFTDSANGIRIDYNSCIPISEHPFGIQFILQHSRYHIHVKLINVSVIQNDVNLHLKYTSFKTTIKIKGLKSVGKLSVSRFISVVSSKLPKTLENFSIIENSHFIGGKITFLYKGKTSKSIMNRIFLSNVCFESSRKKIFIRSQNITLRNITILGTLNGILIHDNCVVNIEGTFSFLRNERGFMIKKQTNVTVHKNSSFIFRHNVVNSESPFISTDSNIWFLANSLILFKNNTGSQSGGITYINTKVIFQGGSHLIFTSNRGKRGGAMAFYARSHILFNGGITNFTFTNNHASIVGGAIYVQDSDYTRIGHHNYRTQFFSIPNTIKKPTFYFSNNTAIQAGDALYGGGGNVDDIKFNNTASTDWSIAATTPFRLCRCKNSKPKCDSYDRYDRRRLYITHVNLLPGQTFDIEVVAVGYWDGTVPANIHAEFRHRMEEKLPKTQQIQSVGRQCTNLSYTIFFSESRKLLLKLRIITNERNSRSQTTSYIFLERKNCTLELVYNSFTKSCVCNPILVNIGIECDLQALKIKRRSPFWVNATFTHLLPQRQSGVIVHNHCPFDYCTIADIVAQPVDLLYPDEQCAFNRSGTLCGACQSNFSHILGTSKCKQCTTPWIALIVPLIAVAGVILVVGLMLLNLTISTGTMNGLIFYANILRANHAVYFPHWVSNSFLSVFIAWLNLDLGIEICFYDGLDAYSKTWLQFFFPLYIWIIVTAIIVASHYSTRVSRLFGNNAIQVLATLFLLSYAKLLRIIITVFSSTQLVYPDGYIRWVWLYDGNVDYLRGKHIGLFVAALLLLLLVSIPYTVSLLCIQWLQKISHYKLLFWVAKLQPLFDAYTGPYKIKHRYWTGLLLLVRVFLYLIFSINTLGDPAINLLSTVVVVTCLLAYTSLVGGVYKILWIHFLETAFLLNSVILPAATLYRINSAAAVARITYTSTGIAFVLFVAIITYHLAQRIIQLKKVQNLVKTAKESFSFKMSSKENKQCSIELSSKVTFSVIDLDPNEPLLCE